MYQKNQNQTQVPNLNNASVQHPSTSQPLLLLLQLISSPFLESHGP